MLYYSITIEFDKVLNDFRVTSKDEDGIVEALLGYAKSLEDVHTIVDDFAKEMSSQRADFLR